MSQPLEEAWLLRNSSVNAVVAWLLAAVLVLVAIQAFLEVLFVRMAVAAVAAAVAIVPALASRSWKRTIPWPLLLVCAIPITTGVVGPSFVGEFVTGLSIAALGMLVVVALQTTSSVRMTPAFAIVFVVLSTLATAGFWAVGSAALATYLGTPFVESNDELMRLFTAAALAGLVAAAVFWAYFRRQLAANRAALGGEGVVAE